MLTLIRKRAGLVLAGLVAALCPMLMAPSGGFPSNPLFQSVGVNTASAGFGSFLFFGPVATSSTGMIGVANTAGGICGSPAVSGDLCLRSTSGRLLLSTNNGASSSIISTPILCTTACSASNISPGQSATVVKTSASTSRNTTTTLTADPDLQFTNVPSGWYRFWLSADYSTGAGGFRDAIVGIQFFSIGGTVSCAGVSISAVMFQGSMLNLCASASGGGDEFSGTFNVAGPTTVSLNWAQNSSNAANSSLQNVGTSFTITRIN